MNEKRQIFVNTYLTNGYDATDAYRTAYPKCKVGQQQSGSRLLLIAVVKEAIDEANKYIKVAWKDRINQVISRAQKEMGKATSVSSLCLLMNAQRGYMDMQAKNRGEYEADNAQKNEQQDLNTEQQALYDDYLAYRRRQLLKGTG